MTFTLEVLVDEKPCIAEIRAESQHNELPRRLLNSLFPNYYTGSNVPFRNLTLELTFRGCPPIPVHFQESGNARRRLLLGGGLLFSLSARLDFGNHILYLIFPPRPSPPPSFWNNYPMPVRQITCQQNQDSLATINRNSSPLTTTSTPTSLASTPRSRSPLAVLKPSSPSQTVNDNPNVPTNPEETLDISPTPGIPEPLPIFGILLENIPPPAHHEQNPHLPSCSFDELPNSPIASPVLIPFTSQTPFPADQLIIFVDKEDDEFFTLPLSPKKKKQKQD